MTGVAFGDLNGDGIPDLVMGALSISQQASLLVFLGNGDGTFQNPISTLLDEVVYPVAVADFNLDGKTDVISCGGWYDVSLMLGNGNGTLQAPRQSHITSQGCGFAVADFDGNGAPDLAVAGPTGSSLLLNAAGSHAPAALLSSAALVFGNTTIGQASPPQTVMLTYPGATALTITGIAISGAQSADFSQTNSCDTILAAGASCTITVIFTPQSTGTGTASIQINDGASNSPQVISLSGTVTPSIGFIVSSGGSNSATVTAGQTASYTLSIGGAGMAGSATLTCTGAPQGATCSVPSSVTVSGASASTVNVSVSTTSASMASLNSRGMICVVGVWATFLLGLALVPAAWRKRPSTGLYLGGMVASLLLISSCGGSSLPPKVNGTPSGTYNLTVTATLNSTAKQVILQLIVR